MFKNLVASLFERPKEVAGSFLARMASERDAYGISKLFEEAYERDDLPYFRGEHIEGYFNPDNIKERIADDKWSWVVFLAGDNLAGTAVLREEVLISELGHISPKYDGVVTHDFYIVPPRYRGHGITTKFLDQLYAETQGKHNYVIHDLLVLSPATRGMRRVLQKKNGGSALGIYPNKLVAKSGKTESLLLVSHYPTPPEINARISPELLKLYNIIAGQFGHPWPVLVQYTADSPAMLMEKDEVVVDASDPQEQKNAVQSGFVPIALIPEADAIVMTRHNTDLEIDFLLDEGIEVNNKLAGYLKNVARK